MIDKKSRRVVIINNIQSDTIDQAIFILKSDKVDKLKTASETNIAKEAQIIINNYIRQVERLKSTCEKPTAPKKKLPRWFKLFLTTGVIFLLTYLVFYSR